jgi:nucleoside phosphorylase
MAYYIEIMSLGDDSTSKAAEVAQGLNSAQKEFYFSLPPERLLHSGSAFVRTEYSTDEVWAFLKDYRAAAKGHRPYLIGIVNSRLRSKEATNLFGSHQASNGLAIITLHDHQKYADSYRSYLAYYFIRYALSFACPELKSHKDTRGCFFDFKENKSDLKKSLETGGFCDQHREQLGTCFNDEMQKAIDEMVSVMRSLQASSSADLNASSLKGQIDVGIITIKEEEFDAALAQFADRRHVEGQNRFYEYSLLGVNKEEVAVVVGRSPEQGQGPAGAIAHDMIDDLAPDWILLVGIAGGFPDSDYTLGDVLLSSRVHDFSVSAALEEGDFQYQQQGGPIPVAVEKLITHLPALKGELGNWSDPTALGAPKPLEKVPQTFQDTKFYGPDEWRSKTQAALQRHFPPGKPPRNPIFKIAPMLTSSTLVKNVELARTWRETARHAAGVEMELGGVYLAARYGGSGKTKVLAIRGISDIVGYKRDPAWTDFACRSAAGFAAAFIRTGRLRRGSKVGQ